MGMIPIGDDNSGRTVNPLVNYLLIAANIAVFVLLQGMGGNDRFTYTFSTVPQEIVSGRDAVTPAHTVEDPASGQSFEQPGLQPTPITVYLTLLVSLFMHGGIAHIAGNMLYLWIFGDNIENALGHGRYLGFYLACGVLASLAHVFTTAATHGDMLVPSLGASGAISGVLGGYLLLFPGRQRAHDDGAGHDADAGVGRHRRVVPLPGRGGHGPPGRRLAGGWRRLRRPRRRLHRRVDPREGIRRGAPGPACAPRLSMPPEKERQDEGPQEVLAVGPLRAVAPRSFILVGLFLLVLFHTLLVTRDLFLPLMLALFLSFLLSPLLRMLKRAHIPEAVGAALLLLVLVGGVGLGFYSLVTPATEWIAKAPESMTRVQRKLRALRAPMQQMSRTADEVERTIAGDSATAPVAP